MPAKAANANIRAERRDERRLSALTDPGDPAHHLPPMLLYRLLKLSNLILRPSFLHQADAHRMSVNELRVLMTLAYLGEAASHELCETAGLHPMNVSRAVGILRRQGHINERRDEKNRRRKLLHLTAEGRRIFDEVKPEANRAAEALFGNLDEADLRILSGMIDKLTANALVQA